MTPEQEKVLEQVAGGKLRGEAEWALLKLIGAYMTKRYGEIVRTSDDQLYAKCLGARMLGDDERTKEREACAKAVESAEVGYQPVTPSGLITKIAAIIRARK